MAMKPCTVYSLVQFQNSSFTRPDTFELYLEVVLEFTKHQSQVCRLLYVYYMYCKNPNSTLAQMKYGRV